MSESRLSRSEVRLSPFSIGSPRSHAHVNSRSQSRSSSRSRPSLTGSRTSQRLIHTISIDSDVSIGEDEFALTTGESQIPADALEKDSREVIDELEKIAFSDRNTTIRESENVEIAYVATTLDSSLPLDYLQEDVLNTIQNLKIPKWYVRGTMRTSPLDKNKVNMSKITGAMTNAIYKVEYPGLPSLLLRLYGPNIDTIIDREYEMQVLARLSRRNIGPSLYGCFKNGRFEQFLENATTLGKDDIRNWKTSQRIARRMKELHAGVPLMKSERETGPICWSKIEKWLEAIEERGNLWVNENSNIQKWLLGRDWPTFKRTVLKYRDWLYTKDPSHVRKGLVFCHNDTQYGNLLFSSPVIPLSNADKVPLNSKSSSSSATVSSSLFSEHSKFSVEQIINPPIQEQSQDSKLVVIDFEYAGANPAAYDLANHFSEWMYDYNSSQPYKCFVNQFPTREEILNFLYCYVSHLRNTITSPIDDEVKFYYNSIIRWRATAQLFWSLWGILQSGKLDEPGQINDEKERPSGGKYIFTETEEPSDSPETTDAVSSFGSEKGVDVDSFDYLSYSRHKIELFWGDLIQFGIADEDDYIDVKVQLDTTPL